MMTEPARFTHDTYRIIDVNQAGCDLFRCDRSALIDLNMVDLIVSDDFKGLAKLRLQLMRQLIKTPGIKYKFIRCDGSHFWGIVKTRMINSCLFETIVTDDF